VIRGDLPSEAEKAERGRVRHPHLPAWRFLRRRPRGLRWLHWPRGPVRRRCARRPRADQGRPGGVRDPHRARRWHVLE
jgi:hypothetical protein